MPRTKVHPLNRRRVAQACDACKKRKEKCDGLAPCGHCTARRRGETCHYTQTSAIARRVSTARPVLREDDAHQEHTENEIDNFLDRSMETYSRTGSPKQTDTTFMTSAPVPKLSRMMRNGKGKFLYIGDSASLSFVQTIRRAISASIGPCAFTTDPFRHLMIETASSGRHVAQEEPHPDLATTLALADYFSLAVTGSFDLFDQSWLVDELSKWVEDSHRSERANSAIMYLSLAIGAQSRALGQADEITAEHYFGYGRRLAMSNFMDDPSLLTVQAFSLITFYMISACRSNAAFMNLGIAVRAAYALGIHRHETNVAFVREEGISRERAWKTLRVFDLFLSASMGRPPATSEADCTIPWRKVESTADRGNSTVGAQESSAIFRICHVFERILTEVYSRRAVSLELAASISTQHREWTTQLPKMLKIDGLFKPEGELTETNAATTSQEFGVRTITMAYYYSIILLARPFLTFRVLCHPKTASAVHENTSVPNVTTYADACVDSAIKGITVAYQAVFDGKVPKRAPQIINCVFISALCLGLAYFGDYDQRGWPLSRSLDSAISILQHFAPLNPQASRQCQICRLLQDAAAIYTSKRDENFLHSSSQLVRDVFGDVRNSGEPSSRMYPQQEQQFLPSLVAPQARGSLQTANASRMGTPTSEDMSPTAYDYTTILQGSMITTSGILAMEHDQNSGYQYQDPFEAPPMPYDYFGAPSAAVSSDFSFGDDVPLFSLMDGMANNSGDY